VRQLAQDGQGHQVRRADRKVVLKGIGATAGAKAAIEAAGGSVA
jgi:large subunit ribosomal protein L15